jgi:hypothetical protein
LFLVPIIEGDLAVGVAAAQHGLASVLFHEEVIPEAEVGVVEVALLEVVLVNEFREFLSAWG